MTILVGLLLGLIFYHAFRASPGHRSEVAGLIRALQRKDTRLDRLRGTLWQHLPAVVVTQGYFSWLRPIPAGEIRRNACAELARMGQDAKSATPFLVGALSDPEIDVRLEALRTLEALGPSTRGARDPLLTLLRDPAYGVSHPWLQVRATAQMALAAIAPQDHAVISYLLDAIQDSDRATPEGPVGALCEVLAHSSNGFPILKAAFERSIDPLSKIMLIDALVRAEPERRRKVSFLLELLDNRDYAVKYEAVRLLGQMGPVATEAFSKLTNLFSLTTDEKNMHANRSFMTGIYIDKASFDTDLTSYWGLHRCTVVALGQLGPAAREVIPFLAQEARDTANPFRFDAAVARWRIDGKNDELLPVLAAGLAAPDSSTRGLALGRITEISSTCGESVGLLVKALGDPEMKIRLGAIQTLADLGTNALTAVPALEGLASDPKFLVRAQARKLVETLQATTPSKIAP